MPIIVAHPAMIPRVQQITRSGQTIFVTTRWVEGNEGAAEQWEEKFLDVFDIRDEFFRVTTERQALDFLRATGEFLPSGDQLSWDHFKRWLRYAELVSDQTTLSAAHKAMLTGHTADDVDLTDEPRQVLFMLTGIYSHTYFGERNGSLPQEVEQVRRIAEVTSETPHQADATYWQMRQDIREGAALAHQQQQSLEHWFYAPPAQVTPQKLQAFINERSAAGLSAATVKHINATLRTALSQVHRWQLVQQNAAKFGSLPRSVRYQPTILSPAQAKELLTFVRGHRYEALFTVALTLGLRRGETLGLRWCEVDLEKGVLKVRHSLERVKGEGLRLSEPKSERAKRELRIPQLCLIALLSHRATQDKEREWAGSKWQDGGFVFTQDPERRCTPTTSHDCSRQCSRLPNFLGFGSMTYAIPVRPYCYLSASTQSSSRRD